MTEAGFTKEDKANRSVTLALVHESLREVGKYNTQGEREGADAQERAYNLIANILYPLTDWIADGSLTPGQMDNLFEAVKQNTGIEMTSEKFITLSLNEKHRLTEEKKGK